MYGALQGLNKAETAAQYGDDQVLIWSRSFDTPPPPVDIESAHYPGREPRYGALTRSDIPVGECLKDTIDRVMPYWRETIAPTIRSGMRVIIAAHGNSPLGLVRHLDGISDTDILKLNIPTGIPLVYELTRDLKPIRHYYLGDPETLQSSMEAVARQGTTGDRDRSNIGDNRGTPGLKTIPHRDGTHHDTWHIHACQPAEMRTRPHQKAPVPPGRPEPEEEAKEELKEEAYILCRQCGQPVTRPDDRISIQGAHIHTFANPHGLVFEIACFRSVIGCGYVGPATDEFSWFSGYRWRIVICSACLTHCTDRGQG